MYFLKNNKAKDMLSLVIISVIVAFSVVSCASAPAETTITMTDVNRVVKNEEVDLLANNGLTAEQLMEVIKLCIQTEELTGVSLVEENTKLSYGVLTANMDLYKKPVVVKFSCSISKNGNLKMRVVNVTEQNPDNPFKVTVYEKDYDSNCASIKNKIKNKLNSIGKTVLARSSDFA